MSQCLEREEIQRLGFGVSQTMFHDRKVVTKSFATGRWSCYNYMAACPNIVGSLGLMCIQFVNTRQSERILDRGAPWPTRFAMTRTRALHDSVVSDLMGHTLGFEQCGDV